MDFKEIYRKFAVSFEIFPPKTDEGTEKLFHELDILTKYNPAFISVTYGAGGSTRDRTLDLALEIRRRYDIQPLVHFTCVGAGRAEIKQHLEKVKELGLTDILALRGDPPKGETGFVPPADGFNYATELIKFISEQGGFNIAVAGYPEKHLTAPDFETDVLHLKEKIDAGANLVLSQLFFNNKDFYRLRDSLAAHGSKVPVIPGIMPLTTITQIEKIISMCGAKIPGHFEDQLRNALDPDEVTKMGIQFAIAQCNDLKKQGVQGFHFYPLNKAYAVQQILDAIL